MSLAKTFDLMIRDSKRVADLGILRNAADFPAVLKSWEKTQLRFFEQGGYADRKYATRETIFQNPATAHYKDVFFEPWDNQGVLIDMTVELARFSVTDRSTGIVRRICQWIEGFTGINDWGNPITGNAVVDGIVWHLRLTPYKGDLEPRLVSPDPFLPGVPYPDLPQFRYLWYMPNTYGQEVNLVVPSGQSLKLIARMPAPGQTNFQTLGRMVGYWQSSEYPIESSANARKGF